MKKYLSYTQAVCLQEVEHQACSLTDRMVQIMDEVEAYSAASYMRNNRASLFILDSSSETSRTVAAVEMAEDGFDKLQEVFAARRMSQVGLSSIHKELELCAQRLFRVLWDLAMADNAKSLLQAMLKQLEVCASVWEDIPLSYGGGSYSPLISALSGVLVFNHCMGMTFMKYEQGEAVTGWSVNLEVVEEAIKTARDNGITEGVKVLTT